MDRGLPTSLLLLHSLGEGYDYALKLPKKNNEDNGDGSHESLFIAYHVW